MLLGKFESYEEDKARKAAWALAPQQILLLHFYRDFLGGVLDIVGHAPVLSQIIHTAQKVGVVGRNRLGTRQPEPPAQTFK